jgi:hypothetical protein
LSITQGSAHIPPASLGHRTAKSSSSPVFLRAERLHRHGRSHGDQANAHESEQLVVQLAAFHREKPVVVDPENHEKNRKKFLAALHALASESLAKQGIAGGDLTLLLFSEGEVGRRAGLTPGETDRIGSEFISEDLVDATSGNDDGPMLGLTHASCKIAELSIYEHSPLGKQRKVKKYIKDKINKGLESVAAKIIEGISLYLAGVWSCTVVKNFFGWIGMLFGQ